jgi:putative DNA primase/helicase
LVEQVVSRAMELDHNTASLAAEYAARGWAVIPLYGLSNGVCTCRDGRSCTSPGKHPKWPAWQTRGMSEAGEAGMWFADHPDDNVGIVCGASGLMVVDIDSEEGERTAAQWDLPPTLEARTRRGRHLYFKARGETVNSIKFAGLDVKAGNGFVVAPPSARVDGGRYEWSNDLPIAEAPEALMQAVWRASTERKKSLASTMVGGETIPSGFRDDALASAAGTMRARGLTEAEILAALKEMNKRCDPPLDERDVERIARSVSGYQPTDPILDRLRRDAPLVREEAEAAAQWSVLSAPDLCAAESERQENFAGALLWRGARLVIGGHTGHGKTAFVLELVKSALLGKEFLNFSAPAEPLRVLIVDLEQGLRTVQRRLRLSGLSECAGLDYLRVPDGIRLDQSPAERAELEAIISRGEYDVVVIDPLYKAHGGDSLDERAMVDLMRVLDAWREEYGFALVIPMHMRKPPSGPQGKGTLSMHDVFGSSGLIRGAEVVVGIERLEESRARLHFWKDREGDLPVGTKWVLKFSAEDGYEVVSEGKMQTIDDRIVTALREANGAGMTKKEIAAHLELGERTVEAHTKNLAASGVIRSETGERGRKTWFVKDDEIDRYIELAGPEAQDV